MHDLSERHCLVVGGAGRIGSRRARALARAGARVDIIDPVAVSPALRAEIEDAGGEAEVREYARGDVEFTHDLVIAATSDRAVNRQVAFAAKAFDVPVNVVDDASLCDVTFPTVIERDPLTIAVSSGGASPVLSAMLRQRISALVPPGYGHLARLVGAFRERARAAIPDGARRAAFWRRVLRGVIAESVFSGRYDEAEARLERALGTAGASPGEGEGEAEGEVYLVGAGPGDPELLTLRAVRLLQNADVVVCDRLVSARILELIDEDTTEIIHVGKQASGPSVRQEDINQLLVDLAREGRRVARLKGGDPFIFGRGGEEIEELTSHGIAFQVIPGITAALGCSGYAGIPLTHRDHARSVRFITGHMSNGRVNLDWPAFVVAEETLVFYMGLAALGEICAQLVEHGMASTMPAAVVEKGTLLDQRVFTGTLTTLPEKLRGETIASPSLLIVGTVVELRERLAWFER